MLPKVYISFERHSRPNKKMKIRRVLFPLSIVCVALATGLLVACGGGKVNNVPTVVDVPAGGTEPTKAANGPGGAIQITVSENGYEPESISVKIGQPVKLAFYRADAKNCGDEVVFAKQNIRKKLPVGETVLVEFTPTEAGEIVFACGMDMLRGKIVVSEN